MEAANFTDVRIDEFPCFYAPAAPSGLFDMMRKSMVRATPSFAPRYRDIGLAWRLFRIESERLKLPAPFSRWITEPLDADAAGQATFHRCFDKVGCEEGERDSHIDLPHAALLARAKFCDRGHPA